jgi:hypothetical protein
MAEPADADAPPSRRMRRFVVTEVYVEDDGSQEDGSPAGVRPEGVPPEGDQPGDR